MGLTRATLCGRQGGAVGADLPSVAKLIVRFNYIDRHPGMGIEEVVWTNPRVFMTTGPIATELSRVLYKEPREAMQQLLLWSPAGESALSG